MDIGNRMTDHNHIIDKIEFQSKLISDQGDRLKNIERLLSNIAVQEERIMSLKSRVDALWRKNDEFFSPDGTLSKIQATLSACPKNDLRNQIKLQWTAIGLIVVLIGAIKLWG